MFSFISPVTNLIGFLSQEEALPRIYLGLLSPTTKSITNSVGEFRFYYNRLLGYIIYNLESAIAEIEGKAIEPCSVGAIVTASAEEAKALIVEQAQALPVSQTPEIVETEDDSDWPILEIEIEDDSLKDRMLACKCQQQLETFKAEIGVQKEFELWEELDILERNYIKSISLSYSPTKAPATTGCLFQYTDDKKNKHTAHLIGHYLYGEPLKDSERSILIFGALKPIVVKKSALKTYSAKGQEPPSSCELEQLQRFLIKPRMQDDEPTTEAVATNLFTGATPSPKPKNGSKIGKKPDSILSKPNAETQIKLNLYAKPTPELKKVKAAPTPALEAIASKLKFYQPQSDLIFEYEQVKDSIYLGIVHGDSEVACFEDSGGDVYVVGSNKLTFHGFTKEEIDAAFESGEAVYEQQPKKA
ncbi:hypothetical protein [Okeania sp. SIO2B3]|uniref:hypothetical protein n=1 Tax=Okeania sp. SIO2B3 TaxID=2607784 RepID=UPI0013BEF19B|nr:hypothetical protein [Okeania sp. SIO2B3]NET44856.1 hypothetical protein [Okeania sp. SIO2B3]